MKHLMSRFLSVFVAVVAAIAIAAPEAEARRLGVILRGRFRDQLAR